jgi:hypothetical protein
MGENKAHMNGLVERSLVTTIPSREKVMVADLPFVTIETPIWAEPVRMIEATAVTLGVIVWSRVVVMAAVRVRVRVWILVRVSERERERELT